MKKLVNGVLMDMTPEEIREYETEQREAIVRRRDEMRCSRFQARAALHAAGLLDQVEALVAESDRMTQIAWADASEWRRSSPMLRAIAAKLKLTDEQIDALFEHAMTIEV